ncbi:hypothetical protein R3P38DRAFT_3426237 [Favolaschia claudopus]|uniref:Uncharacterized protein n=1 Tax=Favolaschia claudopus TaxID=2862362 RepID=A0AAV9ZVP5_9AGAR
MDDPIHTRSPTPWSRIHTPLHNRRMPQLVFSLLVVGFRMGGRCMMRYGDGKEQGRWGQTSVTWQRRRIGRHLVIGGGPGGVQLTMPWIHESQFSNSYPTSGFSPSLSEPSGAAQLTEASTMLSLAILVPALSRFSSCQNINLAALPVKLITRDVQDLVLLRTTGPHSTTARYLFVPSPLVVIVLRLTDPDLGTAGPRFIDSVCIGYASVLRGQGQACAGRGWA